jgi:cytochrome c peroxidase
MALAFWSTGMPFDARFRTMGAAWLAGVTALVGTVAAADPDWPNRALARSRAAQLGLPARPVAMASAEMIALGRKIFFDRRLSLNGTISCGMCHVPEQAFANNEMATAVGFEGRTVKRNAPTLINVGLLGPLFHDGRESALETQFVGPLVAANEMANPSVGRVVELLRTLPDYRGRFEQAFGHGASLDAIGAALAAYQRTLVAGASRFDRWRYGGEVGALTADEQRGFALFTGKAGCAQCHTIGEKDALLTDQRFHDTGYGWWREQLRQRPEAGDAIEVAPGVRYRLGREVIASVSLPEIADLGRYEATLDPADLWKFRTPSLRNVALTAPYMHDGGLRTLGEVVDFYDGGGKPHDGLSPLVRPLGLDAGERVALTAFLAALTSDRLDELVREARSAPPDNW